MSTLKNKAEAIQTEKNTKVLAENIKKDITMFGVTGTYEGGSQDHSTENADKIITLIESSTSGSAYSGTAWLLGTQQSLLINPNIDLNITTEEFNTIRNLDGVSSAELCLYADFDPDGNNNECGGGIGSGYTINFYGNTGIEIGYQYNSMGDYHIIRYIPEDGWYIVKWGMMEESNFEYKATYFQLQLYAALLNGIMPKIKSVKLAGTNDKTNYNVQTMREYIKFVSKVFNITLIDRPSSQYLPV